MRQDIRSLKIAIVNLMPTKITRETQLMRLLGNSLLQVEFDFVTMSSHESKNTPPEHLKTFYRSFDDIKSNCCNRTDKDGNPMANVSVTITDATTAKTGTTNASSKVTLPVKSIGSGGGSSSGGSSGGGDSSSYSSISVSVVDKDGKTVSVSKSTTTTKATLTLPTGYTLEDNQYTITVKSSNKAKADYTIVLKDKNGNDVTGTTDENGVVTLPGKTHTAYIFGYDDGTDTENQ